LDEGYNHQQRRNYYKEDYNLMSQANNPRTVARFNENKRKQIDI